MTLADTLLFGVTGGFGFMLDKKVPLEEKQRRHADAPAVPKVDPVARPTVIELQDLRTGPDTEVHRFDARVASLSEEISHLRSENQKLTAANHKLNADLREIKLLLSKLQIKELHGLEKVDSWLRSLKLVL